MRQFMPADRGWLNMGPARAPRPGKAGVVAVSYGGVPVGAVYILQRTQPAYSDKELIRIIREGETHPRQLTPAMVLIAEAARVAAKEDLRIFETQFAGLGVSGTYGSLDRRTPRREGSSV
jgi:hypothetical protein